MTHKKTSKKELRELGFTLIGTVEGVGEDLRIVYEGSAREEAGKTGVVYLFVNADWTVWKVGQSRKGWERVNYSRIIDGSRMKYKKSEPKKLARLRDELSSGATQWVRQTESPLLLEAVLTALLRPTETDQYDRRYNEPEPRRDLRKSLFDVAVRLD